MLFHFFLRVLVVSVNIHFSFGIKTCAKGAWNGCDENQSVSGKNYKKKLIDNSATVSLKYYSIYA